MYDLYLKFGFLMVAIKGNNTNQILVLFF